MPYKQPRTYVEILNLIACGESWEKESFTFNYPGEIPNDVLLALAQDEGWNVRYAVATRPCVPDDIALILAMDVNTQVRHRLLDRFQLPVRVLRILAQDRNETIRKIAIDRIHQRENRGLR